MNLSGKKVLIGLSGGINSMAVLCWLGELPKSNHPKELHLFYADFKEHSDDTIQFVLDGVFWAKRKFEKVIYKQTENSVNEFFESKGFIPHPTNSVCSYELKIKPMLRYCYEHQIDIDLIGFVSKEIKRYKRLAKYEVNDLFFKKEFPILNKDDEWCFQIVKRHIGWYPKIYDIKENGKRVFNHNNCLPCKNMTPRQFNATAKYYPDKIEQAFIVQQQTGSYWGRSKCDIGCVACEFD